MADSDTKRALLECAQDLIQRVGINAMSYNDLSKEVGIRKASIHYHFPKKEDLIRELQANCQRVYGDNYLKVVNGPGKAADKLRQLTQIYIDSLNRGKLCLMAMLSAEYETVNEETRNQLDAGIKETISIYEKIFIQGVEDGEFVCDSTYDSAFAFLSLLMGGHIVARCSGGEKALRNASEAYIQALLKATG
jgi:TetR/AcrR family transcriptional repressor of nem operon